MSLPLLERLTIALVAALLVAALVAWIKYDMQRTAVSQPATRGGVNGTPTRGGQLTRHSGCAATVTPITAVDDRHRGLAAGRVAAAPLHRKDDT